MGDRGIHLAVFYPQLLEVMRDLPHKDFFNFSQTFLEENIALKYDLFEIFELLDSSQNRCEFCIVDAAVVKDDPVDELVEELERPGQRVAMANTQSVAL